MHGLLYKERLYGLTGPQTEYIPNDVKSMHSHFNPIVSALFVVYLVKLKKIQVVNEEIPIYILLPIFKTNQYFAEV